jgi:hypothetical protein
MKQAGSTIMTAMTDPDIRRQMSLAAWMVAFLFGWVTFLSAKAVVAEHMCAPECPALKTIAPTVQK